MFDVVEASDDPENGMFPRFLLLSLSFFFKMVYFFFTLMNAVNMCMLGWFKISSSVYNLSMGLNDSIASLFCVLL